MAKFTTIRNVRAVVGAGRIPEDIRDSARAELYENDGEIRVLWREPQGGGDSIKITPEQRDRIFGVAHTVNQDTSKEYQAAHAKGFRAGKRDAKADKEPKYTGKEAPGADSGAYMHGYLDGYWCHA